ncbi:acetyl-CoA hydrolase/transferase family protein [Falsiporphyromonas endometrii]|uniref:Acetyl-CoA hydrolase/transferase family protein n=1 Tax=Falsiporphyromonas endometrii TaxID=1387297 RepID=A0ABV9K6Q5_9PORP
MNTSYQQKIVSALEAVKHIPNDSFVVMSHAAGVAQICSQALADNYKQYSNVKVYHMLCLGTAPYCAPEMEKHIKHVASFVGGNTRQAVAEGRADFIPAFFYQIPTLFRNNLLPVDVAIVQVSEPNSEGYCSFGLSCDYTKPAAECAKIVIAEMNKQMPFVGGDNLIHVDKLDYIVEADYALPEIPLPKIGDVEKAIGKNVASLIKDGATLQLGIGAIPDAVLGFLGEKKDLGIHTEMFSDGVIELVKSGVVTGKAKEIHKGKLTATFLMGSKALYDFVDNNPDVELAPVDWVNDPLTVMQLDNIVSINSCIEVDLMGQVSSESMGLKQFSGTGGQVDYVRGAAMAKNGISIMAMPSTAKKGTISRIVPFLQPGSAVTTSRCDVDYVITEYGIAHLRAKTLRERAKALIAIAHPDFRNDLLNEFAKRFPNE